MKWISADEELPPEDAWILAYGDARNAGSTRIAVVQAAYRNGAFYFWELLSSGCGCCDGEMEGVTHWMPLPDPPTNLVETGSELVGEADLGVVEKCYIETLNRLIEDV